jgi:hypothetical protein
LLASFRGRSEDFHLSPIHDVRGDLNNPHARFLELSGPSPPISVLAVGIVPACSIVPIEVDVKMHGECLGNTRGNRDIVAFGVIKWFPS